MYKVWFTDLMLFGRVGVTEAEREVGTRLRVSLEVSADGPPPATDGTAEIIDYSAMIGMVDEAVQSGPAKTLESLAARIAAEILAREDRVSFVQVSVGKVPPPTVEIVGAAGVTCGFFRS